MGARGREEDEEGKGRGKYGEAGKEKRGGGKKGIRTRPGCSNPKDHAAMDETDIMDLTHQKARKRARPITSVDESIHASLKRLPMRAAECREPSLMFAVRGEPVPAASLKQNDHSVTSSPNTVMPAQVKSVRKKGKKKKNRSVTFVVQRTFDLKSVQTARFCCRVCKSINRLVMECLFGVYLLSISFSLNDDSLLKGAGNPQSCIRHTRRRFPLRV